MTLLYPCILISIINRSFSGEFKLEEGDWRCLCTITTQGQSSICILESGSESEECGCQCSPNQKRGKYRYIISLHWLIVLAILGDFAEWRQNCGCNHKNIAGATWKCQLLTYILYPSKHDVFLQHWYTNNLSIILDCTSWSTSSSWKSFSQYVYPCRVIIFHWLYVIFRLWQGKESGSIQRGANWQQSQNFGYLCAKTTDHVQPKTR